MDAPPLSARELPAVRPPPHGMGKRACTILADQGDFVTIVSDVPYNIRSKHVAPPITKGSRPMHRSTLGIKTQRESDYQTTLQTFQGGPSSVPPPLKRNPFISQQASQIKFGIEDGEHFYTSYGDQFPGTGTEPARHLHFPSHLNKLNMNEGGDMKGVLDTGDSKSNYRYWSQYNRIHNKLGVMLGPGVERERDVRQQYDPLTGLCKGGAWHDENRRVSGNRLLYNQYRRDATSHFVLG